MDPNKYISQGHGISHRFGGLTDPYGAEKNACVVLLQVPFDKTSTYQKGSSEGPEALIEASRNMELYDIETGSEVFLNGIYTASPIACGTTEEMLLETYKAAHHYIEEGKFVVTLGGEHTISYGAIKAHAEKYAPLTILQFDAHADLQPSYEDNPWSHASVMSRVKELPNISKTVSVGIRSLSSEELPYLAKENTFFAHDIFETDLWMDQALSLLSGNVYITFDLDAFDSAIMPSTGTPEPGGLQWNPTLKFLKMVAAKTNLVGFDVVELCPNPYNIAPDYLAAKLVYKLLSYKFQQTAK
ncbi:MAG: agmatinase [Parachlamydiales bacterium]|jgi:agmatinase